MAKNVNGLALTGRHRTGSDAKLPGAASSTSRSASSGRFVVRGPVSEGERVAAARARVSADKKRGATTAEWIVELARQHD